MPPRSLPADRLGELFGALSRRGYACVGPTLRDGAIVYDRLAGVQDLPQGWTDEQAPGHYRLRRRDDEAYFGYAVGPQSWKKELFPPERRVWALKREGDRFVRVDQPAEPPQLAFIGVRACEIAAMDIQARVFLDGEFVEEDHAARRGAAFVVAVSCTESAATCFCASMSTGPQVEGGNDLALTEVLRPEHHFLIEAGSERGAEILDELKLDEAPAASCEAARADVQSAADSQERSLDAEGIQALLQRNTNSAQWDSIAERCLSCANCTMACPTCFCSSVEDVTDLTGEVAERHRHWDSCFNPGFSYLHGGEVRQSTASRYRQWMTHKLSTWHEQFGSSGCVGCGRCITWCPVGIDITEEARLMAEGETR